MKSYVLVAPGLLGGALLAAFLWGRRTSAPVVEAAERPVPAAAPVEAPAAARSVLVNQVAYIPPQCYARTREPGETKAHNSCFTCHRESAPPNYVDDEDVQTSLSFAQFATKNHWTNLLHPPEPVVMADAELLAYVRSRNDSPEDTYGAHFHFDEEGFDRAPDGHATGWRAFAYYPMPGMFWPTNGSAGDALIRLPEAFRQNEQGADDGSIYRINLALLEAYIAGKDVAISEADERTLGVDLDGDGRLGTARRVAFRWPVREGGELHFVGKARTLPGNEGRLAAGLYPPGTEFLHTLRYLDVDDGGQVRMGARMKEVRYMRKTRWFTYSDLELAAQGEAREKTKSHNRLKRPAADGEHGVRNGLGWVLRGAIEDASGKLRPQSFEETSACIGCHGGVGATTDSTFAFARKLGPKEWRQGWYHFSERGFSGLPEPRRKDGKGEYAHWLAQVGGGDDYRANDEIAARFFRGKKLDPGALQMLAKDVATLLVPSKERAFALNRAYLAIVRAQSFVLGREVAVGGQPHMQSEVIQDDATGIENPVKP